MHLGAVLLAVAAHAGMLVLLGSVGEGHVDARDEPVRAGLVSAYLATPPIPWPSGLAANESSPAIEPPSSATALADNRASSSTAAVVSITTPTGPYYFRPRELTRRPILLGDAISRIIIDVPGFPPAPVILRLLISEEGNVDRVVVEDSYLPVELESRIVDAFAGARFLPGKIEDAAVRSQLKIEVRLESVQTE